MQGCFKDLFACFKDVQTGCNSCQIAAWLHRLEELSCDVLHWAQNSRISRTTFKIQGLFKDPPKYSPKFKDFSRTDMKFKGFKDFFKDVATLYLFAGLFYESVTINTDIDTHRYMIGQTLPEQSVIITIMIASAVQTRGSTVFRYRGWEGHRARPFIQRISALKL